MFGVRSKLNSSMESGRTTSKKEKQLKKLNFVEGVAFKPLNWRYDIAVITFRSQIEDDGY
jgi:hypothetical protein